MPLTAKQTLAEVVELRKRIPVNRHPVWVGLQEGTHTLDQIREFAKQFGIIPLHNHNYHGRLYVTCPDPEWRARLAEVVYEEGTGRLFADGVPHNELYYRFGEGLGLSRKQLFEVDYCKGARAYKNWLQGACGRSTLEGIAAHMLADEAQVIGGIYRRITKTLQDKYDLPKSATDFWSVHDVADEDHSGIGAELLADFAPTERDRRKVLKTVAGTLKALLGMYDDIERRMAAIEKKPRKSGKTAKSKAKRAKR